MEKRKKGKSVVELDVIKEDGNADEQRSGNGTDENTKVQEFGEEDNYFGKIRLKKVKDLINTSIYLVLVAFSK